MTTLADIVNDIRYNFFLDDGFVGLIESMGDDKTIAQSFNIQPPNVKNNKEIRSLIRNSMRNKNMTPFSMVELKYHLKIPMFIASLLKQFNHAVVYEESPLNHVYMNEPHIPDPWQIKKTAMVSTIDEDEITSVISNMIELKQFSYEIYNECLDLGVVPDLAATQLPLSTYTELYWKINLADFFDLVTISSSYENDEFIDLIHSMILLGRNICPFAFEAFDDYGLNGLTFSSQEALLLKRLISPNKYNQLETDMCTENGISELYGMTVTELKNFKLKIGLGN